MAMDLHFSGPYVSQIQSIIDTGTTEADANQLYNAFIQLYQEPRSCGQGCCFHIHKPQDDFVKDLCKALMEYVELASFLYENYQLDEFP